VTRTQLQSPDKRQLIKVQPSYRTKNDEFSKLNSNKKQFLRSTTLSPFTIFRFNSLSPARSQVFFFVLFFDFPSPRHGSEKNDKIIYQIAEFVSIHSSGIYIKTSSIELNATRDLLMHSICIKIIQISAFSSPHRSSSSIPVFMCHSNWISTSSNMIH
jgi:hypothetical protein